MTIKELIQACVLLKENEEAQFEVDPGISIDNLTVSITDQRSDDLVVLLTRNGGVVNAHCYSPTKVLEGLFENILNGVSTEPDTSTSYHQIIDQCVDMELGETKTFILTKELKSLGLSTAAFLLDIRRAGKYPVCLHRSDMTITALCYDPEEEQFH